MTHLTVLHLYLIVYIYNGENVYWTVSVKIHHCENSQFISLNDKLLRSHIQDQCLSVSRNNIISNTCYNFTKHLKYIGGKRNLNLTSVNWGIPVDQILKIKHNINNSNNIKKKKNPKNKPITNVPQHFSVLSVRSNLRHASTQKPKVSSVLCLAEWLVKSEEVSRHATHSCVAVTDHS